MLPILAAVMQTVLNKQALECPKCRKKQLVSSDRRQKGVTCKHCGAQIPAPSSKGSG